MYFDWGTPSEEPLSVADVKAHGRIDVDAEDALLEAYIVAARGQLEFELRRCLIAREVVLTLDCWPDDGVFRLPGAPVRSVTSVTYTDENGDDTVFDAVNYVADTAGARIVLKRSAAWPSVALREAGAIVILYVAGYGASGNDVPGQLLQALRLLVAHWYENREAAVVGAVASPLPLAVERIVNANRWSWF